MKKNFIYLLPLLLLFLTSCENEPIGDMNINQDIINVDSDIFGLIERAPGESAEDPLECIRFNYSFTLFIFDENDEFLQAVGITDDATFIEVLGSLSENQSISLSYPISGTNTDGELIEIRNNEELEAILDSCLMEETKTDCDKTLTEDNCLWEVSDPLFVGNPYNGAHFRVKRDGTVRFYYNDKVYFGTWVTLFVADELHLNIFLSEDETLEEDWNLNWKVDSFSDELMTLSKNTNIIELTKKCILPCSEEIFTACEEDDTEGIAEFDLQERTICYPVNPMEGSLTPYHFTFHETLIDAENDSNSLPPESYNNIANPQEIYVRIENSLTEQLIRIENLNIQAVQCD